MEIWSMSGNEVVILGAGFSHAASWHMPLMKELGRAVLAQLRSEGERNDRLAALHSQLERTLSDNAAAAASPGFEAWLARLAEDQPYVSQHENLERRALFSRVSEIMWEVMVGRQEFTLVSGQGTNPSRLPKDWLDDIVSLFHQRRTTVITLNYDNLVEHAVLRAGLWGDPTPAGSGRPVRADDLYDGLPAVQPPAPPPIALDPGEYGPSDRTPAPRVESLRLLKLQGSLSWFWIPQDQAGTTLAAWNVIDFGRCLRDQETRRRDLPGREPFLVPPTTSKASYFETMVTRELWRRAYEALEAAERVVLVGYSLPTADSTFLGLLADTTVGRDLEVVVVNTQPKPVKAQLVRLGIDKSKIRSIKSVADWVEGEVVSDAAAVVARLRSWSDEEPARVANAMLVVSSPGLPARHQVSAVTSTESGDELVLSVERDLTVDTNHVFLASIRESLKNAKRLSLKVDRRHLAITQLGHAQRPAAAGQPWYLDLHPIRPA